MRRVREIAADFFRVYAAVLFCDSPRIGAWFALVTCWSPKTALAGLAALLSAAAWGRLLGFSASGNLHLVNALLSGLFIGAFHALDWTLLGWVAAVALFVTLLSHWLAGWLWQVGRLPLLSLPFVLACWLIVLASQVENAAAMLPAPLSGDARTVFGAWADGFFSALGWLLLTPYPVAGALLFACLLAASRYLAALAVAGYVAGQAALLLFGRTEANVVGYNFMLATMALGGIFAVPGRASFLMALAGAATAAWFGVALGALLYPFHLPLLTLPFILAVYLWLGGLDSRIPAHAPHLTLETPQAPEPAFERVRLAQVRGSVADSVPVMLPFYGEWRVTQAFNGPHTHQPPWQHALDFEIVEEDRNHRDTGMKSADYFCFGSPVLAPVTGQVAQLRSDLQDVPPGDADIANNWGNFVLLRTVTGDYVLLAHLRQDSVSVHLGEWVAAGRQIAACGSSGRSPEPHLHLQVQRDETLGSPTHHFHLVNVLVCNRQRQREFRLYHQPQQDEIISAAPLDAGIASALNFPPGGALRYRLRLNGETEEQICELRNELTLLGQPRWVCGDGASAAFERTTMVLGGYDRQGPRNPLLNMWLLAVGLTPLSAAADRWQDRPPLGLLPLDPLQRLLVAVLRPLGAGCSSSYRRTWDEGTDSWQQQGTHRFQLIPGIVWIANTTAWIVPGMGVKRLHLRCGRQDWDAVLTTGEK